MIQTLPDVNPKMHFRFVGFSFDCRFENAGMLVRGFIAPVGQHLHLIPQILVVHGSVELQQVLRAASGNERLMELRIIAFPELLLRLISFAHFLFHPLEFVMGRDHLTLPLRIAVFDGKPQGRALQQNSELRNLLQVRPRNGCNEKPPLLLGLHEALAGQPVQGLTESWNAGLVRTLHTVQLEFRIRCEPAEDDVGPNTLVGTHTDSLVLVGFRHIGKLTGNPVNVSFISFFAHYFYFH